MKKISLLLFVLSGLSQAAFDDAPMMDTDLMDEEVNQQKMMAEMPPQFDETIDVEEPEDESGLSAGAIAGIAVGGAAGLAALGATAYGAKQAYNRSGSMQATNFELSTPTTGEMAQQDTTAELKQVPVRSNVLAEVAPVEPESEKPAQIAKKTSVYQRITGRTAAAKAIAPGGEVYAINQRAQAERDIQRQLIAEQTQDRKQVSALAQRLQGQQERIAQIENQREFARDAVERAALDDRRAAALAERDALQEQQTRAKRAFIQKWTAPQTRTAPAAAQEPKLAGTNPDRLQKDQLKLKTYADDANKAALVQQARQSQFDPPAIPKRRR